jgi:amino acid transporter
MRGVGGAAMLEIVTVWGKLFVLVGVGGWGIYTWAPEQLSTSATSGSFTSALIGSAVVFMAYEGFQLLSYDYEDIEDAKKTVPRAMTSAIVAVIGVYLIVLIGAVMLVGPQTIIDHKEVALAKAGEAIAGEWGLWIVTIAAVFSTSSAINATLFAVGRLAEQVAVDGELPKFFAKENSARVPARAIAFIGGAAALLAAFGSLGRLVEAASLGFLITFAIVNALAWHEVQKRRWVSVNGLVGSMAAIGVLIWRQATQDPTALLAFIAIIVVAVFGRRYLVRG